MGEKKLNPHKVIDEIKKCPSQKIKVAITDIDGVLRGKYMNKDKFLAAADNGFGFCNVVFGWDINDVCYDNSKFTGWHTGYPDVEATIDLSTYRKIPWDDHVPFFLADFKELSICPRQLLKKIIKACEGSDFQPSVGCEFEWFNFKETPQSLADKKFVDPQPLTPGMFGYSVLRSSLNQPFVTALIDQTREFGIPLESLHTETGPGVYEAAILYSDALEAADRATLFKTSAKEIGYRHDVMPSFMAKWSKKLPGCSGHVHQSLWDKDRKTNLFYDESDEYKMSKVFKCFLAGQMKCLPEFLPLYAPNINSYKRLVEGLWAPTRVNWGVENRTTAFRVIPGSSHSTRLETRVTGSDINPYLAIAGVLGSGLYGIHHDLKIEAAPVRGNGYAQTDGTRLSKNLLEATDKFSQSRVANEIFGEKFVEHFSNTRIWEWRQFMDSVTGWELERYFELV